LKQEALSKVDIPRSAAGNFAKLALTRWNSALHLQEQDCSGFHPTIDAGSKSTQERLTGLLQ